MRYAVFSLALLLLLTSSSAAIAQNYFYAPEFGGLVDLTSDPEDPLVWAAGPELKWLTQGRTWTYNYVMLNAPNLLANAGLGGGYTDWRVPTKAELQYAAAMGLYQELVDVNIALGFGAPYKNWYWAADPRFKQRGYWFAYVADIETGATRSTRTESALRLILVRGGNP